MKLCCGSPGGQRSCPGQRGRARSPAGPGPGRAGQPGAARGRWSRADRRVAGRCGARLSSSGPGAAGTSGSARRTRTPAYELWLLSWLPGQQTGFHDHGDAAGAFAVADGAPAGEHRPAGPRGRSAAARCAPARSARSAPAYVHDVRNVCGRPAVSVHAYSPPLSADAPLRDDRLRPGAGRDRGGRRDLVARRALPVSIGHLSLPSRARMPDRLASGGPSPPAGDPGIQAPRQVMHAVGSPAGAARPRRPPAPAGR